jgi:hypothetical protein
VVVFVAKALWPRRESVSFEMSIHRRTCQALAFEAVAARAGESFAFEFAAARTSKAISLEARTRWAMRVTLAFESAALGGAGEAIKTFANRIATRRAIKMASLEVAIFVAAGKTTTFGTAAFESRTSWTPMAAVLPHVLMDGFGHFHEFVLAEFAVFIFVELFEHLGGIGRMWTAASVGPASAVRSAFAGLTSFASAALIAHFFARLGAFVVI